MSATNPQRLGAHKGPSIRTRFGNISLLNRDFVPARASRIFINPVPTVHTPDVEFDGNRVTTVGALCRAIRGPSSTESSFHFGDRQFNPNGCRNPRTGTVNEQSRQPSPTTTDPPMSDEGPVEVAPSFDDAVDYDPENPAYNPVSPDYHRLPTGEPKAKVVRGEPRSGRDRSKKAKADDRSRSSKHRNRDERVEKKKKSKRHRSESPRPSSGQRRQSPQPCTSGLRRSSPPRVKRMTGTDAVNELFARRA